MGWENIFHCEWNEFGQKILNYYWPHAISYTDITKTDFSIHRGSIDILTGGFPCQPYSQAGKRKGKEDDRHLWPEMLRAIREIQPRWVVGENVSGLLNWNGGMVLDEIKTDLEAEGFEVVPPCVLPACAVNAPHRRDRVWIIAYSKSNSGKHGTGNEGHLSQEVPEKRFNEFKSFANTYGNVHPGELDNRENSEKAGGSKGENEQQGRRDAHRQRVRTKPGSGGKITSNATGKRERPGAEEPGEDAGSRKQLEGTEQGRHSDDDGESWITPDTNNTGLQGGEFNGASDQGNGREQPSGSASEFYKIGNWINFPTQSPLCNGDDGLPSELDGITFPKWRNESIKAGGNAIVPQVVFEIFKAIQEIENSFPK